MIGIREICKCGHCTQSHLKECEYVSCDCDGFDFNEMLIDGEKPQ